MNDTTLAHLREMLTKARVLALAVVADEEPIIGLLPDALASGGDALIVHASHLARHSRGLVSGAPYDALIHEPATPEADPLQVPRLTLRGRVRPLDADRPDGQEARRVYLERIPGAEQVLGLGGFRLYRLEIEAGRLVAGFARAVDVSPQDLARASGR